MILLLSFLLSHLLYFPLKKLSLFFSVLKLFLLTSSNLLHCWIIVVKNTWDEHVEVGFCCSYLVWLRYRQGMMFPAKTNPFWQEQLNFLHTAYTYLYMYGQKYSRLRCLLRVKGLVIFFYLGWSGSILQFKQNIIKVGWKSWLLTCSSNITLRLCTFIHWLCFEERAKVL